MSEKEFDREEIVAALNEKGANNECHRCGHEEFSVADGYSFVNLSDDLYNQTVQGPIIPTFLVICNNCGAITHHALGAYMELEDEKSAKGDDNE